MRTAILIILLSSTVASPLTLQQAIEQYRQSPDLAMWGQYAATYKIGERYEQKLQKQINLTVSKYWNHLLGKYIVTRREKVTIEVSTYSDTSWYPNPERTPPDPNQVIEPVPSDPNTPIQPAVDPNSVVYDPNDLGLKALMELLEGQEHE